MTAPREDLRRRLAALSVSSVCDADKELTPLDPAIRLVADHGPVVGPARLVVADDDHLPVLTALVEADPGDVLLVAGGARRAVLGELFAAEAARRGLAGIVIAGFSRDVVGLRAAGVTVYARGTTPASGTVAGVDPPPSTVRVGGVEAREGDLVL